MLKLHEVTDQYLAALDYIDEHADEIIAAGGVLPDELAELLDQAEGELEAKIEQIALLIQTINANADVLDSEIKRLQARRDSFHKSAEGLKGYVQAELTHAGIKRVKTARISTWVQKNGRPSLTLIDPENIPEAYRRERVIIDFDSQAAYDDLKAAGELPDEPGKVVEKDGIRAERGSHLRVA